MMDLRAGFAAADITPGRDCPLVGYDFRFETFGGTNDGVLDPLGARVVCLKSAAADPLFLFSLDLCVLESGLAGRLRASVAESVGSDARRVFLCCTHTHSGPFPRDRESGGKEPLTPQLEAQGEARGAEAGYTEGLERKLCRVARQAAALVEPVDVRHIELPCAFGYNRRVPREGGVRLCWNVHEYPGLLPARNPDPTVSALLLRQASGRALLLWSAGVHPVTLGKTSNRVSADWPGAAARFLREWIPDCEPMYFHGAGGEVHPWLATQDRAEALEVMGRAAAAPLAAAVRAARAVEPGITLVHAPLPGLPNGPEVSVLRMGAVALVFLPLEFFASLSVRVRAAFTQPVFFATVSNGWEGYWPDEAAFAAGGYEVEAAKSRGRGPRDGERLADTVSELLRGAGHT
ncbi:MAG: hypothetical protein JJU00_10820 [Opitutales bacterium]|nr:hypothetical protein [Opitutales bacterium]